ncbi:MAG: hypothetical protein O2949_14050, partial [Proteobacteria bacterium]|nr:hypothetical protein [Pseudomonadota bacterium]
MAATEPVRTICQEDIETFHRDGAVLLKGILDLSWVDTLARGLEFIHDHPDGMSAGVNMPLRIDQFPASHSPDLQHLLD